jgi:hypothetical protein
VIILAKAAKRFAEACCKDSEVLRMRSIRRAENLIFDRTLQFSEASDQAIIRHSCSFPQRVASRFGRERTDTAAREIYTDTQSPFHKQFETFGCS